MVMRGIRWKRKRIKYMKVRMRREMMRERLRRMRVGKKREK